MTKKHKREEDIVGRLEKENRELKALVRSLQRRLKKVDKEYKTELEESNKERYLKEDAPELPDNKCTHCERGNIIETVISKWRFLRCNTCDFKEKKPNG